VTGGTIQTGQGTTAISVLWQNTPTTGSVQVDIVLTGGMPDSIVINVDVQAG
jgi:hypothetical protein